MVRIKNTEYRCKKTEQNAFALSYCCLAPVHWKQCASVRIKSGTNDPIKCMSRISWWSGLIVAPVFPKQTVSVMIRKAESDEELLQDVEGQLGSVSHCRWSLSL